jgi:hypothetical protein
MDIRSCAVTNKILIFPMAAILALAVMTAGAQQKNAPEHQKTAPAQQKTPVAPQTIILTADSAAGSRAGQTTTPPADSAAPESAAVLKITTDPPEAAVKIDDKDYGLSPVEVGGLDTGYHHVVELIKSGYFRRKATIRLGSAGAELHFELSRPATLLVTSEPAGAQITIDGQNAGTAPVQNDKIRPGEHQVMAELDGYKRFDTTVELKTGGVDTLRVTLEPGVTAPPMETPASPPKGPVKAAVYVTGIPPMVAKPFNSAIRDALMKSRVYAGIESIDVSGPPSVPTLAAAGKNAGVSYIFAINVTEQISVAIIDVSETMELAKISIDRKITAVSAAVIAKKIVDFILKSGPKPDPKALVVEEAASIQPSVKTKDGKSQWQSSTILIAFFVFIAVLIGVEKSSY